MYKLFIKRLFDFFASFIGIVILSPIFVIIFVILLFTNNFRPFFLQVRPGKNEKTFTIIKFKTMNDKKDAQGELLSDKDRLTWIGRILRKSSLDEIPQLVNVLKGDMSVIGPRPLLVEYLELYNEEQKKRHLVSPGITGWAQINGRNAISWDEKFKLDIYYVDNLNFMLDIKILIRTIKKVIFKEDVIAEGSSVIGRFKGNKV